MREKWLVTKAIAADKDEFEADIAEKNAARKRKTIMEESETKCKVMRAEAETEAKIKRDAIEADQLAKSRYVLEVVETNNAIKRARRDEAEQEQKAAFDKADLALKTAQAKDAANKLNQKRQEDMDAAYDKAKDDFINAPDANARDSAKIKLSRMMKARNPNIKPLSLSRQINDLIRKPRVKK
jgi:hypothetical protein